MTIDSFPMPNNDQNHPRRDFLKQFGLTSLPFLFSPVDLIASSNHNTRENPQTNSNSIVNFVHDGLGFSPTEYINKLGEIDSKGGISNDFYGTGGSTYALEQAMAKHMGKEKAIYLPTGTMANQLAIALLNGENTKIIVPENSHIFRDEADAAQSVYNKRLIPVGKDKPYFNRNDLQQTVQNLEEGEVFKSGLGTVALEHPVRRADGTGIPLKEIEEISKFCKQQGYKMHLDGARIHIAAAFAKTSVAEYAVHFDTVYISLYKYLNAAGGAILCGKADFIEKVSHHIKIHGGTVYQTWLNTAMALYYLENVEARWAKVVQEATLLISGLNDIKGVKISTIEHGTNIYHLTMNASIDLKKFSSALFQKHQILLRNPDENGLIKFVVNESLFRKKPSDILSAWKSSMELARM